MPSHLTANGIRERRGALLFARRRGSAAKLITADCGLIIFLFCHLPVQVTWRASGG